MRMNIKICIKALFVFITFRLLIYFLYFCTSFVKIQLNEFIFKVLR